jgi:hypothetical protein
MRKTTDPRQRFARHVQPQPNGCWEWQGNLDRHGYGTFYIPMHNSRGAMQRKHGAHRASHVLFKGPIAPGLCIDHLCRNPRCVNPAHLEAVTPQENTLRGESFSAVNARKRRCIHGHCLADPANVYRQGGKRRQCRRCNLEAVTRYNARRKAQDGLARLGPHNATKPRRANSGATSRNHGLIAGEGGGA